MSSSGANQLPAVTSVAAGRTISLWDSVNNQYQLVYGDTGWRDISAGLINGWIANKFQIRRINRTVIFKYAQLDGTAKTATNLYNIPLGFTQNDNLRFVTQDFATTTTSGKVLIGLNVFYLDIIKTDTASQEFRYETDDAWPTVLPGVAVGPIPNT